MEEGKEIGTACCVNIHHACLEVAFPSVIVWFKALAILLLVRFTA